MTNDQREIERLHKVVDVLLAACEAAELVIEQSYEVNDYPANGESRADKVLVILSAAIAKAKGEKA